jgi:hypothetical protein
MGWRLAVWAASWRIPRPHGEPCLVLWPRVDLAVRVAHLRGQARPGAQRAGIRKPADVADLGDHGHRGEPTDTG